MITPSYAPTATERVLPRMALDFTTGVLDPRVTVARALDTATRVNSSGYIEIVNANLPRFDYSPTSVGTPRGLLIEETRANLVINSQTLGSWSNTNFAASNNTTDVISPDGLNTAEKFTDDASNTRHAFNQSVTISASTTYTTTIYARIGTGRYCTVSVNRASAGAIYYAARYDLQTVSVTDSLGTGGATHTSSSIADCGNGWFRLTLTGLLSTYTDAIVLVGGASSGAGFGDRGQQIYVGTGLTWYFWGAQLEAGAFATSYIPTTTTSLTRNADVVSMTGTNFSDWFNATEGTFAVTALRPQAPAAGRFPYLLSAYDAAGNRLDMYQNGAAAEQVAIWSGGSQVAALNNTTVAANTVINQVAAYKQNSFAANVNAGTLATDTAGNVPVCSQLFIGHASGSFQTNGWMQRVRYWPQRCINSEVTAFSKG